MVPQLIVSFFPTAVERIAEAQAFEGLGIVVNEHYTKQEHIRRRQSFLGQHLDWRHQRCLLPKVYREADEVFTAEDIEISIQQVRVRELSFDIEPLLPLCTTSNTQSLDSFASYGPDEWNKDAGSPRGNATAHESRIQDPRFVTPYRNNAAFEDREDDESAASDARDVTPFSVREKPNRDRSIFQHGRKRPVSDDGEDTTFLRRLGSKMSELPPGRLPSSTPGFVCGPARPIPSPLRPHARPAPGASQRSSSPSAKCRRRGSFAAERPNQTVAPPTRRPQHLLPPPRRRRRRSRPRISRLSTQALHDRPSISTPSQQGPPSPPTPTEAHDATTLLHARLLAAQTRPRARGRRPQYPEHAPEFFKPPPPSWRRRSRTTIRCLCGARRDARVPGQEWVACDDAACGVWQHVACVGAAVEADPRERERSGYRCHACDPFRHREGLARIRRGEGI